jgi:16S rRNA (cytosine967-C5)-methyltransferase
MPSRRDARSRAVDVLRQVLGRGGRATPLLAERGRNLPAGEQDLFRELVLGVLRWRSALDAEIASVSRIPLERLAPKLREILEVALYQVRHLDGIPDYAAVSEAVSQGRASGGEGAARLVNGVLRGILLLPPPARPLSAGAGKEADTVVLARYFSHPEFLVARWRERFGLERTLRILEADNRPSPVDLMVNPARGSPDEIARELSREGIATRRAALSPLALTVTAGSAIRSPLFAAGAFTVQDVGSQALALLLPPGETLVDLAAAPGGKSFAALWLGRASSSVAVDRSFSRLGLLEQNRRRLAAREIHPVCGDAEAPPLPPGSFDRVLFDAPCSGTGTLRKNPEIRYRLNPAAIERLAAAQEASLAAAAKLLAPGGYLLYATCSLEAEENERVVARVRSREPGLEPAAIEAPESLRPYAAGPVFRLFPDAANDGFTAHLLKRA